MQRPVFLRTFAPQFGTPTIYRVAVANISKCATNLSSETAAVLTAKTRRPSSGCKLRVQFPGASAVYPSSMRHPNVVQTLGMEHVEGLGTCIVMEYVDGITLAYIHSLGIAHRDLKPQNIILTRQGLHVKLYKSYR